MAIQVTGVNAKRMYSVVIRGVRHDAHIYTESGVMGCDVAARIEFLTGVYKTVISGVYADVIDSDGEVIDW